MSENRTKNLNEKWEMKNGDFLIFTRFDMNSYALTF
jgi:hypothetical protein